MKPDSRLSELRLALLELKPTWISTLVLSWSIALLGFASAVYMLQVYERVVNSRDVNTLVMLSIVVLGAYAVMELLEKFRSNLLWSAGIQFEMKLADRLYAAMFESLRKQPMSGAQMVQGDMRTIREFFYNPAV